MTSATLREYGLVEWIMIGDWLHEVVVLWWKIVALVTTWPLVESIWLLAHFLHASWRLADNIVAILGIHRFHIFGNNFIFALLTVQEGCIAVTRCHTMLHIAMLTTWIVIPRLRVQSVLVSCASLARLLHLDCVYGGARSNILAIEAVIVLDLLLILGVGHSWHIHIV